MLWIIVYRHACKACSKYFVPARLLCHDFHGTHNRRRRLNRPTQRDRGNQARVGKYLQSGDGIFYKATSLNLEAVFSNSTLSDADATEHSFFKLFKLGQKYNLDQG
jgi:hypothetical protein